LRGAPAIDSGYVIKPPEGYDPTRVRIRLDISKAVVERIQVLAVVVREGELLLEIDMHRSRVGPESAIELMHFVTEMVEGQQVGIEDDWINILHRAVSKQDVIKSKRLALVEPEGRQHDESIIRVELVWVRGLVLPGGNVIEPPRQAWKARLRRGSALASTS
jgi:hypothetical protein